MRTSRIIIVTFGLVLIASFVLAAEQAQTVSPGAADRFAEVVGRCPTFSWTATREASGYEVVVYRSGEDGAADLEEVLSQTLPRGATAWTPELGRCLEPGASYVWFVRGVTGGDDEDIGWSEARQFLISRQPSAAEVEHALEVLRRYSADTPGDAPASPAAPLVVPPGSNSGDARKHVTTTATASIKGEMLDPDGEAYGVIGISNSANGAGVGAGNTNNGPDLVLDGSEDGNDPDAVFTQAGIGRNSSEGDTMWFLLNPDENHALNLHVEGSIQFGAEGTDGGIFYRNETTGDLHLRVDSPELHIDIGGDTRLTIDNTGKVTIDGTTLELNATDIDIKATNSLDLEAVNINATASANVDIEGAQAELSASGITTVKGSLVKIN